MIYKIKEYKNKLVEKAYKDGLKECNTFFGFNWTQNLPNICIFEKRKDFNLLYGKKTESWLVGTAQKDTFYVLDNKYMEKESCHKKYSDQEYSSLIKHELCHIFYTIFSKSDKNPTWLDEGVSIYVSGQLKEKKPVENFSNFIEFYDEGRSEVYAESGMAVKLLVEKLGKKRLLILISRSKEADNKTKFAKLFKQIYNFDLNYKNFNNLLNKK